MAMIPLLPNGPLLEYPVPVPDENGKDQLYGSLDYRDPVARGDAYDQGDDSAHNQDDGHDSEKHMETVQGGTPCKRCEDTGCLLGLTQSLQWAGRGHGQFPYPDRSRLTAKRVLEIVVNPSAAILAGGEGVA